MGRDCLEGWPCEDGWELFASRNEGKKMVEIVVRRRMARWVENREVFCLECIKRKESTLWKWFYFSCLWTKQKYHTLNKNNQKKSICYNRIHLPGFHVIHIFTLFFFFIVNSHIIFVLSMLQIYFDIKQKADTLAISYIWLKYFHTLIGSHILTKYLLFLKKVIKSTVARTWKLLWNPSGKLHWLGHFQESLHQTSDAQLNQNPAVCFLTKCT